MASDTSSCPDTLLPYLQTKLGFFTSQKIDSDRLRIILQAFPHIVKNKGSRNGIILAIRTFLKCIHRAEIVHLDIHNLAVEGTGRDYFITIGMNGEITDISILTELLRYVVPTGYDVQYYFFRDTEAITSIKPSDSIRIFFIRSGQEGDSKMTLHNSKVTSVAETYKGTTVWEPNGNHRYEVSSDNITDDDRRLFNTVGTTRVVPNELNVEES